MKLCQLAKNCQIRRVLNCAINKISPQKFRKTFNCFAKAAKFVQSRHTDAEAGNTKVSWCLSINYYDCYPV